jgi:hypothetical protein
VCGRKGIGGVEGEYTCAYICVLCRQQRDHTCCPDNGALGCVCVCVFVCVHAGPARLLLPEARQRRAAAAAAVIAVAKAAAKATVAKGVAAAAAAAAAKALAAALEVVATGAWEYSSRRSTRCGGKGNGHGGRLFACDRRLQLLQPLHCKARRAACKRSSTFSDALTSSACVLLRNITTATVWRPSGAGRKANRAQ